MSRAAGTIAELAAQTNRPCMPTAEHLPRVRPSRCLLDFLHAFFQCCITDFESPENVVCRHVEVHAKLSS